MPRNIIFRRSSKSLLHTVLSVIVLVSLQFFVVAQVPVYSPSEDELDASSGKVRNLEEVDIADEYVLEISGTASHYAHRFNNRRTASGEKFDINEFTAAHRKLPFGTIIRVTNLANDKSVLVRVNDRGPHIRKRVLDLSYAAAKEIEGLGLPRIKVEGFVQGLNNIGKKRKREYYFGYSTEQSPICVPKSAISVIDSLQDFANALKLYEKAKKVNGVDRTFIFTKTDTQEDKNGINYYIAVLGKNIVTGSNVASAK